jgi:hypothetical protein
MSRFNGIVGEAELEAFRRSDFSGSRGRKLARNSHICASVEFQRAEADNCHCRVYVNGQVDCLMYMGTMPSRPYPLIVFYSR